MSVAERRAGYVEGYEEPTGIIGTEARATDAATYIEGGKSTEAERVVYVVATNGNKYGQRMRFWDLANENSHFVGDHTITVATRCVESAWDRASKDATMPDVLREAVAKAKASPDGAATIVVNDAGVVKRWLKKRTVSFPQELRPHLTLETPHNSRTAYSIIGQFPHDMSLPGMCRSLDKLVDEFKKRGIPCEAVVHEPTAKNSKKNWHFHLIYYAGPAELLPDGRWSFERENQRDKWGTMKSVPIKRLGRDDEVAADDWVPKLKQKWSEIVNARAIAEGIATRFTNETNKARGLPKAPTRYTPGRQALHKQGFFTNAEIDQNVASWSDWEQRKRQDLATSLIGVQQRFDRLCADARRTLLANAERASVDEELRRCQSALGETEAVADVAAKAITMREMIVSGPNDVLDHYAGVDATLSEKTATPSRVGKRAFAQTVCAATRLYLAEQEPILATLGAIETAAVSRFKSLHTALNHATTRLDAMIDSALSVAAPKRRGRDSDDEDLALRREEVDLARRRISGADRDALRQAAENVFRDISARSKAEPIHQNEKPRDGDNIDVGQVPAHQGAIVPVRSHLEILARSAALRRKMSDRWLESRRMDDIEPTQGVPSVQQRPTPSWLASQLNNGVGR